MTPSLSFSPLLHSGGLRALLASLVFAMAAACESAAPLHAAPRLQLASAAQEDSPPLPADPDLRVTRFANGVTFLSRSVPATPKGVVLGLLVRVGSLAEQADERGFAHFVEHLAINGTLHAPGSDLEQLQREVGLVLGPDANAATSQTFTSYLLEVPGASPDALERAVRILSDWASRTRFDAEAVRQARAEVLAEKRAGETPAGRLQQLLSERWLRGSPYADHAPIGVEAVLQAATPERLAHFYQRWYQAQNITVVVNGDFDIEAMRRLVEREFASLPQPEQPLAFPRFEVPVSRAEIIAIESCPELPADQVEVGLKRKPSAIRTEADYRRALTDRLIAILTRRRVAGLAAGTSAPLRSPDVILQLGDVDMFDALHLQARATGAPQPALAALLAELERIARLGFTPRELELARTALELDWTTERTQRGFLRQQALELARRTASGEATFSLAQEQDLRTHTLSSISLELLNQQARRWALESERLLLIVAHTSTHVPAEAEVRELAARVRRAPVVPYADTHDQPLMARAPAPGMFASEEHIEPIDTWVWTLANGARVVFKPLQSEPGRIAFESSSPGGTYRERGPELVNALLAPTIIGHLGLGAQDAANTERLLSQAGVQMAPWITDYREGVHGRAHIASLEQLFQALHLTLSQPGRDALAFESQRQGLRENLASRREDANSFFEDEIQRQVWNQHPRYSILPPEATDLLDLDSMRKFYLERFGDVGDFTFVFVGDTSRAQIEPLVRRYLATLPGSGRIDGARHPDVPYRSGITRVHVERGAQTEAVVDVRYHGEDPLPPHAEKELDALRVYLGVRLREVLREQLGGVYEVGVSYELRAAPRDGYEIGFRFACKPDQVRQLEQAAFSVVEQLRTRDVPAMYVETIEHQLVRSAESAERSTIFWLDRLLAAFTLGRDPAAEIRRAASVEHIDSDLLRRAARRYLRSKQYVEALLLPDPLAHAAVSTAALTQ